MERGRAGLSPPYVVDLEYLQQTTPQDNWQPTSNSTGTLCSSLPSYPPCKLVRYCRIRQDPPYLVNTFYRVLLLDLFPTKFSHKKKQKHTFIKKHL